MKRSNRSLLCIACIVLLGICSQAIAKKCKKFNSVCIRRSLTVLGKINGATMGQLLGYGSFVNVAGGEIVAVGAPVPFTYDSIPPLGMAHMAAPFTSITLIKAGVYYAFFRVHAGLSTIAVQLYRNGVPIVGADDSGINIAVDGIIFAANAGDVITLVNIGAMQFMLGTNAGTSAAVLVLTKIA